MTSEGLGEMFEGDSADMGPRRITAHVDGGKSGGSSVRRPGSKGPVGASGILYNQTLLFGKNKYIHLMNTDLFSSFLCYDKFLKMLPVYPNAGKIWCAP